MRPSTPSVIVDALAGLVLRGAVTLDNGMLGLVFEDNNILAVAGTAYLMHEEGSANVMASARKRLSEAAAELETLSAGVSVNGNVGAESIRLRDEQSLRALRKGDVRRTVSRTLGKLEEPAFLAGDLMADSGQVLRTEIEKRARTEELGREIPEVSR